MENLDVLDDFLADVTTQITQCNFDKAKDLCKKEKVLTTSGLYKEILNVLPSLISVEKCYSELGFLASKSKIIMKKDNILKSAYNEIKNECEKLQIRDDLEYNRILSEVIQFTKIRGQLIDLYEKIYAVTSFNKHWRIEEFFLSLNNLIRTEIFSYEAKTMATMKISLETETECLYNLLNAQFYLENWNLVQCTSHISSLKARLSSWEKNLHKETWKVNFLRSSRSPELFRWMLKFKTYILEKYSLYFYMIIRQQTSINDLKTLCNKQHLEFLQRFQNLSRKSGHEATSIMLIFDACGIKNWHGPGYHCPLRKNKSESSSCSYYIMVRHPERLSEPFNLMPTIRKMLVEHFSDILFLDKVVCRYIASENSTYFVTSIEERISLVSFYNCKKDDKKIDIDNYMLELAWMIRCHRIFLNLNPFSR